MRNRRGMPGSSGRCAFGAARATTATKHADEAFPAASDAIPVETTLDLIIHRNEPMRADQIKSADC